MAKCEIIIVKYGLPELEAECVSSVETHTTDVDHKLTVHDNYEADEGLSKVWNDIIRESDAEYICLLNNDTRVEAKWLSRLLECFKEDGDLGALGPMTNASTGPQGNRKYRTKSKNLLPARYPLVGFCLVFPRHVWEEIGGFDEEYEIYGEDSDFCMKVWEHGFKCMIRTDVFIFHHGKSSTPIAIARGKDILRLKAESKDRFIKRWRTGKLSPAQREAATQKKQEAALYKHVALQSRRESGTGAKQRIPKMTTAEKVEAASSPARVEKNLTRRQERRKRYLEWKAERRKKL